MKEYFRIALIITLAALLFGCGGIQNLEMDIQRLQIENKELKRQMNYVLTKLDAAMKRLESDVFPMSTSVSNHLLRIEKLESEHRISRDKLDQNSYKLSQTLQQLTDLKYRIKPGTRSPRTSLSSTPSGSYPSKLSSRSFSTLSPNQIYQTEYADYLKGNYDLAVEGFREYLRRYSDSDLAATVQYWMGECYYAKGNYRMAITELDKVIVNYPKDEKVKSAALKKGFALFELNKTAQGVIIMQQIIREFPHSRQSRIAKEKLESLGLKP